MGRWVRDEDADWIVVSTPSSGWFTCAGELGPGIAMLLALAEWVTTRSEGLNYLFVATSGHELDFLGARLFHEANLAPPPARTHAWLHLGASVATPPWRLVEHGYRGLGIVGGSNPWFHVPGDDPRTVSPETLAAVTSAIASALSSAERFDP